MYVMYVYDISISISTVRTRSGAAPGPTTSLAPYCLVLSSCLDLPNPSLSNLVLSCLSLHGPGQFALSCSSMPCVPVVLPLIFDRVFIFVFVLVHIGPCSGIGIGDDRPVVACLYLSVSVCFSLPQSVSVCLNLLQYRHALRCIAMSCLNPAHACVSSHYQPLPCPALCCNELPMYCHGHGPDLCLCIGPSLLGSLSCY